MASPGNRHCANYIGTLLFPIEVCVYVLCCISYRNMMMTVCDLAAITKPWEIQKKVQQ